jgi:signal transduction histidine kinase
MPNRETTTPPAAEPAEPADPTAGASPTKPPPEPTPEVEPTPEPTFESADLAEPTEPTTKAAEPASSGEPAAPPGEPAEPLESFAAADPRDRADAVDELFRRPDPEQVGPRLAFGTRLTIALIAAAVLPLAVFGLLLVLAQRLLPDSASATPRLLLLAIIVTALISSLAAYLLAADLTAPLRAIAAAVDRAKAGDLTTPIDLPGDDELARLAESHNRLAADLERRNRELGRILAAIVHSTPRQGLDWLIGRAGADAREAFGLVDAEVRLVDPATVRVESRVPGEPRPVRADLRAGDERIGVLLGHAPVMRTWERADQDLLEVFAAQVGVALRNAELFATVEAQNAQLLELDAAKDDFLRGVSHNLQTPLTSIRAYADQLARTDPDRRVEIIGEQADRLSRMVRQLLTVTRLESGALRPTAEVLSLASRVRKAWEALAVEEVPFEIDDQSAGWLAVGDADQLDQVLWALLDNAVKYGARRPVTVHIGLADDRLRLTIADHGPGVAEADRGRLFGRFERGSTQNAEDGSGLGLYVARELARAMGGDLVLEPAAPDRGAAFSVWLPAEVPLEG